MAISRADLHSLQSVLALATNIRDNSPESDDKAKLEIAIQRTRKIYVTLLHHKLQGNLALFNLTDDAIPMEPELTTQLAVLCPDLDGLGG